jgi:hypothetical protein
LDEKGRSIEGMFKLNQNFHYGYSGQGKSSRHATTAVAERALVGVKPTHSWVSRKKAAEVNTWFEPKVCSFH